MSRLVSVTLGVLLLLVGCSSEGAPDKWRIAQLAPITTATGSIPAEANQYGVLISSYGGYIDGTIKISEPFLPLELDETGKFTVQLPESVPEGTSLECPYYPGIALLGGLLILDNPATGAVIPSTSIRGKYRLETTDGIVLYWYSPVTQRLTCENTERGNVTGGAHEDWDMILAAGWNQVLAVETPAGWVFRTRLTTTGSWVPWAP